MNISTNRFLAFDVLRGIDLALMIIVNTPGSWSTIYRPFLHAPWHGFTLTDLVFPTFLFVVGNAMSFSLGKYENKGEAAFWLKIVKRAIIIFLIGFLIHWFPFFNESGIEPLNEVRVFGVLQRIALCYFLASVMIHYLSIRSVIAVSILILIAYHAILIFFGDLTLEGNAVLKFDLIFLTADQMYQGEGIPFDPEGFLSTFPAVINVIGGYLAGNFLRKAGQNYRSVAFLMIAASILIFLGFCWDLIFPFNKKIWSSSFVLLTIGIDLVVLGFLVYVLDIQKKVKWSYFFQVFGKNTLFIYIFSNILVIVLYTIQIGDKSMYGILYYHLFYSWLDPYLASLLFAISYMFFCWGIGYVLDKKGIYIKV